MNYHKIEKYSTENGIGIRCVLWVSGCSLHCKGCQNPSTWDFDSGKPFDEKAKQELFEVLSKPYIHGLTLSGGHPLDDNNYQSVIDLVKEVKTQFPTKDIWLYTGYTLEEIYYREKARILLYIDVLVDGPYIEDQRDISLSFRGSRNQRLINIQETLKQGQLVTLQND